MANYPGLALRHMAVNPNPSAPHRWEGVVAYLIETWLDDYATGTSDGAIVEVSAANFSYLFDMKSERLIAAWGVSRGPHSAPRDKHRMAGHPLSAGPHYHRGHAIAHSLGGGTDINLVPQVGRINVGAFQRLEREAVATPGSFYFSYWHYPATPKDAEAPTQTPSGVDQGLLVPGTPPRIRPHGN